MPKIAAIIINHSHGKMIRKALESLSVVSVDQQVEIFVINNIPDIGTKAWVSENYPNIILIENQRPMGFAENINHVIKSNTGFEYYLLINPDVICIPGLLNTLIEAMEADEKIGAAGPQLLNLDGSIQPSRRRFASFLVLVIRALHIDRLFPRSPLVAHYLMTDTQFVGPTSVDWVTGALMILRKKALDEVGLMDERFNLYFEDEDLCCRMWQSGWKVCYNPKAQAYHAHLAAGRNKIFSRENYQHILSAIKMLIKYRGKITRCYHYRNRNQDI
jgi:GT2 family glycosyltransferase